ncbi:MAG: oxaloacetate decarboxylase [Candidatus Delongbacteria bacterium]|nr:oxaloacetate decarboxylase [Candidatus Delongbacteria bacterium]MBN2836648.1 oxaloacetate decarboxylase [Candidatus Delongbacteria bacterium]
MGRQIKFSLLYRDMWQSSGKYVPTVDMLKKVAPAIIKMGCFARVETNGGGFEQINLLFGENPNNAVREWTKPFNEAGIQCHMLERALNGIRMNPVPKDIRRLMYKVKKAQGVDISRSFCGLNDHRNLELSVKYAKEAGMISQAALSITHSELHTVEYYMGIVDKLVEYGADEIALKDMAGVGRPVFLGNLTKAIKDKYPHIVIQYHGHAGPGFASASILEVARAGAEYIDVAMEPLSWGTGHVDVLTAHAMLKDAGFDVPDINMDAYMEVRALTQSFMDEFLGYFIDPKNRLMNSLLIGPGLPGGMMGSLMADLKSNLVTVNKSRVKAGKSELNQDELLVTLFNEVAHIWPKMGYPPLVTPFSQYVKNIAMFNIIQMEKGQERFSMIDDNTWSMLLGKSGKLPGVIAPELVKLAQNQKKEFYTGNPQDLYPDQLDTFREEMKKNGWDFGKDEEELFELAMHPQQYRAYKSGKAKEDFKAEIEKEKGVSAVVETPKAQVTSTPSQNVYQPKSMNITVNGEVYKVEVSYDLNSKSEVAPKQEVKTEQAPVSSGNFTEILSPLEGKFFQTKDSSDVAIKVGDKIKKGDKIGYIESMKVFNPVAADAEGIVAEVCFKSGDSVDEDEVLVRLK